MKNQLDEDPVTSWQVFRWPEFQAFMERLGSLEIVMNTRNVSVLIELPEPDGVVTVQLKHHAIDNEPKPSIDTTTQHNETYTTRMPNPRVIDEAK